KEKAFLMRNFERDLGKIELKIKEKETKGSEDIIFTDTKGKEHTLTKQTQEEWLNTFNLKSLDEAYTPKHSDEIKEALGGKEIKLQLGSLKKLTAQGREKYIPQIKEVLDSPEAILKDSDNAFLFAKHLKDDDYFVNVSVDKGEYLVSISNGIKETNNIKNKLDSGAEVVYQSPNANSNLQTLLQASRYSANKIDGDIITQKAKEQSPFNDIIQENEGGNQNAKQN
uniref:PBECR2 nuclease fold domain-containing protein n=1 Tax=uncultured Campylobacter sp. TaxID=218934 RepID=UPI0026344753